MPLTYLSLRTLSRSLILLSLILTLFTVNAQALEIEVVIFGQQYQLDLEENSRLKGFASKQALFFKGKVKGYEGSWVRLSKVNNSWVGKIYLDDQLYNIDQAIAPVVQSSGPSAPPAQNLSAELYDSSELADARCGLSNAPLLPPQQEASKPLDGLIEGAVIPAPLVRAEGNVRVLDLQLALDYHFVKTNGGRQGAIDRSLSYINEVDAIYEAHFGVNMNVINFDVFETAQDDPTTNETAAGLVLGDIQKQHKAKLLFQHPSASLKHLITNRGIDAPTVGLAWIGNLCTGYPFSLSQVYGASTALVMAHEIAHNFGAHHDGEEGTSAASCNANSYIMSPSVSGARTFSECSKNVIQMKVDSSSCIKDTVDVELVGDAQPAELELGHSYQRKLQLTNLSTIEVESSKVKGSSSDASITFSQVTAAGAVCTLEANNSTYSCDIAPMPANASIEIVESFTSNSYGEPQLTAQYLQPNWRISDITIGNNSINNQYLVTAELGSIYAGYTAERLTGVAPLTVNFDASSSKASDGNSLTAYDWQVSNGDVMTAQAINSYTFTQVGEFDVSLTVTDSAGQSDSVVKTFNIIDEPTAEPAIVSNLTATPISGGIKLSWDDAELEQNYTLYRRINSMLGSWAELVSLPKNSSEYTDITGSSFNSYRYYIIASNNVGDSGPSAIVIAKPGSASQPTDAKFSLSVSAGVIPLLVNLDASASLAAAGSTISSYTWVSSDAQNIISGKTSSITYYSAGSFIISLTVTDSNGGTATIQQSVQVTAPDLTLPAAASNLSTSSTSSVINLQWQDNSANETGFIIQRASAGGWQELANVVANSTQYQDQTAVEGVEYQYQIVAVNDNGQAIASNVDSAQLNKIVTPVKFSLNIFPVQGEAPLKISLATMGATASTGATITNYQWTRSDGVIVPNGGVQNTVLTLAGSYTLSVTVSDSNGQSTTKSQVITVSAQPQAPATPTQLIAVANSENILLSWQDNSDNETGFIIYRADNTKNTPTSSFQQHAMVAANITEFKDDSLQTGITYQYQVVAASNAGNSSPSTTIESKIEAPKQTAPIAPSNYSTQSETTYIQINWQDNSDNELEFVIFRRADLDTEILEIGRVATNITSFKDETAEQGIIYDYGIMAVNAVGNGSAKEIVQAQLKPLPPTAPLAPSDYSAQSETTYIQINWQDNSDNELEFVIYRRADLDTEILEIGRVAANITSFKDETAEPGIIYDYGIMAVNTVGNGAAKEVVQAQLKEITSPIKFSLNIFPIQGEAPLTISLATMGATASTGATITNYQWTRSDGVIVPNGGVQNTVLTLAGSYTLSVTVSDSNGQSTTKSQVITVIEPPQAPAAPNQLSATASTENILLSWQDNSDNETGFIIYRRAELDTESQEIGRVAANITNFKDETAKHKIIYDYSIMAVNTVGNSTAKEIVQAQLKEIQVESQSNNDIEQDSAAGGLSLISILLLPFIWLRRRKASTA